MEVLSKGKEKSFKKTSRFSLILDSCILCKTLRIQRNLSIIQEKLTPYKSSYTDCLSIIVLLEIPDLLTFQRIVEYNFFQNLFKSHSLALQSPPHLSHVIVKTLIIANILLTNCTVKASAILPR